MIRSRREGLHRQVESLSVDAVKARERIAARWRASEAATADKKLLLKEKQNWESNEY